MDAIRRMVECCDHFNGFQFTHGIAGGTGSGMMMAILAKCRQLYTNRIWSQFTVFPHTNEVNCPHHSHRHTASYHIITQ
jgi:hypothetical protein